MFAKDYVISIALYYYAMFINEFLLIEIVLRGGRRENLLIDKVKWILIIKGLGMMVGRIVEGY